MRKRQISSYILRLNKLAEKGRVGEYLKALEEFRRQLEQEKRDIEQGIEVLTAKINAFKENS